MMTVRPLSLSLRRCSCFEMMVIVPLHPIGRRCATDGRREGSQSASGTLSPMPACGERFFVTTWASAISAQNLVDNPESSRTVMMASTVVRFGRSERELRCEVCAGVTKRAVPVLVDELAASVRTELLDFESGERLDLEEPAANGVERVTLPSQRKAPELPAEVVADDEEVPGACDRRSADVEEVAIAAVETSGCAIGGRREGKAVCLPNLAWIANTNPTTRDTQTVDLVVTCEFLDCAGV